MLRFTDTVKINAFRAEENNDSKLVISYLALNDTNDTPSLNMLLTSPAVCYLRVYISDSSVSTSVIRPHLLQV